MISKTGRIGPLTKNPLNERFSTMVMQHNIDSETHSNLSDNVKSFYEADGDGFKVSQAAIELGIETDVTQAPLRQAKKERIEAEQRQKAEFESTISDLQAQLKTINDEREANRHKKAVDEGDIDSLLASQAEKMQKQIDALNDELTGEKATTKKLVVDSKARALAAELGVDGAADLLYPHIIKRMDLVIKDGVPEVQVLDENGKPTVNTVDDLKSEFLNNAGFSRVIKGSLASGGGADQSGKSGGGSSKDGAKAADYHKDKDSYLRQRSEERHAKLVKEGKI